MLKITLKAGLVGTTEKQRKVVRALGLGKYGSCAFHADSPTSRGMITKVSHMICVKADETPAEKPAKATAKK